MTDEARKAVIMARGLGTRMRKDDRRARLGEEEARVASTGVKALMPMGEPGVGRPFLDFVISGLADGGFDEVCLVIGPEHDALRRRYTVDVQPKRVRMSFAVQPEPLGTADAVASARAFAGDDLFLVMNSDNYYPTPVLRALRLLGRPGLPGFERDTLVRESNIEPERIARYALLRVSPDGYLQQIVEKPDQATARAMGPSAPVSMNCWLFGPRIFDACAAIRPSPRGELELADAVERAVADGEKFVVFAVAAGVLDLSSRGDIAEVRKRLQGVQVSL